ncbi:hypothetical protein, partial [Asticcacaulis sp.]|uniref:hypothetical protein n=1 Tax=Asticcacaulis sp. TaxID=1872648 RepID=UPI0026311467
SAATGFSGPGPARFRRSCAFLSHYARIMLAGCLARKAPHMKSIVKYEMLRLARCKKAGPLTDQAGMIRALSAIVRVMA